MPNPINQVVRSELGNGRLTLTLDRPEIHNALNHEMLAGLRTGFQSAAADPAVRVVVIRAEGPSFSAGLDLAHMARLNTMPRHESVADGMAIAEVLAALYLLPQATVAAVQGPVFGGALAIVAACDLVVATQDARFSAAETRLGLTPVLLTPYLAARVGLGAARRMLLTSERIAAQDAWRIGLVDQLVAPPELQEAVSGLVERLKQGSPGSIAATKRLLAQSPAPPLTPAAMRDAAETIATARAGAEASEGIAAFLAKRKPSWAHD